MPFDGGPIQRWPQNDRLSHKVVKNGYKPHKNSWWPTDLRVSTHSKFKLSDGPLFQAQDSRMQPGPHLQARNITDILSRIVAKIVRKACPLYGGILSVIFWDISTSKFVLRDSQKPVMRLSKSCMCHFYNGEEIRGQDLSTCECVHHLRFLFTNFTSQQMLPRVDALLHPNDIGTPRWERSRESQSTVPLPTYK